MIISIADAADLTGLTPRAIRYYEERGLIRPRRDPSGARLFDEVNRRRLLTIAALRRAGLTLEEISQILGPDSSEGEVDRRAVAEKLRRQRAALQQVTQQIELALASLEEADGEAPETAWLNTTKTLLELEKPWPRPAPTERDYGLHRAASARRR